MFVLCLGTHCKMQCGCHMMCKPWVLTVGFALRGEEDNWHFPIFQHMKLSFCSNSTFKSSQITCWVLLLSAKVRQSSIFSGPFPLREGKVSFGACVLVCSACARGSQGSASLSFWTMTGIGKKQLDALIGLLFLNEGETLGSLFRSVSSI